jgi:hypothetical protein
MQEDLVQLCASVGQQPSLRSKLVKLASEHDNLDPYESPAALLHQAYFAKQALKTLDNKEDLEKITHEDNSSLQRDQPEKHAGKNALVQRNEADSFIDRYGCSQKEINEALAIVYEAIDKLPETDKLFVLATVCQHDEARYTSDACIGLLLDYNPELLSRVESGIKQLLEDRPESLLSSRIQIIKHIYGKGILRITNHQVREIATSSLQRMGDKAVDALILDMQIKNGIKTTKPRYV